MCREGFVTGSPMSRALDGAGSAEWLIRKAELRRSPTHLLCLSSILKILLRVRTKPADRLPAKLNIHSQPCANLVVPSEPARPWRSRHSFLDENVPHKLRRAPPEHDVRTVPEMGRGSIKNGKLLKLVEDGQFDVLLTGDKNLPKQQHLSGRRLAVVGLSAISWPVIRKHLPEIARMVDTAEPGTVKQVQRGLFRPRKASGLDASDFVVPA
jgi:hypothetical protein